MPRPQRRRRKKNRILPTLAILLPLAVGFLYWSNTSLQVTNFNPMFQGLPSGFDGCRIVVLSDTQSMVFGDEQTHLLKTVAQQDPDYIFFAGDMTDRFRDTPANYVETLASGLSAIAPTYYVTGNHEWAAGKVRDLKSTLTEHGVTVLSNQYIPLERNGDTILLAGIDDPNGYADQKTPQELAAELYAAEGDTFWLLLAHRNDRFANEYSLLGADLVISGHAHGGIIRLPFTDGVFSHNELFPTHTSGLYEENDSVLFVTRGLGSSAPACRLFNRPEVAVLTLYNHE